MFCSSDFLIATDFYGLMQGEQTGNASILSVEAAVLLPGFYDKARARIVFAPGIKPVE